jgi:hypothetical protein
MQASFHQLESLPPHPEKLGLAIKLMAACAVMLCLLAVLLAWYASTHRDNTASGCKLVPLPNAGVPFKAEYKCADGTTYYAENSGQ